MKHIGISTHTPEVAQKALDMGILDMMMFSVNPGYDYRKGDYAIGSTGDRMDLYRRCEKEGVAISAMKAFSGGQLLDVKTSPFGQALTEYQCIQYALDKPGVVTVLPGIRNKSDVERVLGFLTARPEERDYSVIGSFVPRNDTGYLRVLQPLPALSYGHRRGPGQQVLRPGKSRGRIGSGALQYLGEECLRLREVRPLREPLPLPCEAGGAHGGNRRLLRALIREARA